MSESHQQIQFERNRRSRGEWEGYRAHREQIAELVLKTPLVRPPGESSTRLGILGAGNGNDLDLSRYLSQFDQLHLIDLDAAALQAGIAAQQHTGNSRVQFQGGLDLTNCAAEEVHGAPFEATLSVGLLTQLIEGMLISLPADTAPDVLAERFTQLRQQHIQLLCDVTRAGGWCWLTVEVVSSDTCPELLTAPNERVPQVVQTALQQQNFFSGCHPGILWQQLQQNPRLTEVSCSAPWRWTFFGRVYAVVAFRWRVQSLR